MMIDSLSVHKDPDVWPVEQNYEGIPKVSDIVDKDILSFIHERSMDPLELKPHPVFGESVSDDLHLPQWVFHWDFESSPWRSWPWKVVESKLVKMMKKGYLNGCDCGCRGDWELTDLGYKQLNVEDPRWSV